MNTQEEVWSVSFFLSIIDGPFCLIIRQLIHVWEEYLPDAQSIEVEG